MSDLLFQQFSTVQSNAQLGPATIAAATTIAPTTGLTFVTGTTNIATITSPVTGAIMIGLVFTTTTPGSILTTGNVSVGSTLVVQNRLNLLWYDPASVKWYMVTP